MLGKITPEVSGPSLLFNLIKPYRPVLVVALLLLLCESGVLLMNPWLAGQFTQALLGGPVFAGVGYQQVLLLWLGVLAVQALLAFANRYLVGITGEKILTRLRLRLYDHLQALPLGYFHEQKRGEVLSLVTYDAYYLSQFITGPVMVLLPQVFVFIGALGFIYLISPPLALLMLAVVPLFSLLIKLLGRRIRPISRAMVDEYAHTHAIIEENLQLLPVIKSFTREDSESGRFQRSNQVLLGLTDRYLRIQSLLSPLIHCLAAAAVIGLLWICSEQLGTGELTLPALVSLLLYGMLLVRPVSGFADMYGQLQRTRGAVERLVEVFNITPEPLDAGAPDLPPVSGRIEFCGVEYRYPGRERLLDGVDLLIEAGETVAITGENGAGKSTLVALLQRFIEPDQGRVLLDGQDIAKVSLSSLRKQIGVVSQQVLLLNGTVRDNIAFGRPDAGEAEIKVAARSAHALAFIQSLPEGFDTVIGDQGIKLSGGQQQRLALARALLKDPPILVLDEATAMFDPEGEQGLIEQCQELLRTRTVIIITHRPATLALADRVVKMSHGKVYSTPALYNLRKIGE